LTSSSEIEILPNGADVPTGSAIVPVSKECEAYLILKGVIDVKKETERLNTKKDKIEAPLKRLRESIAASDYDEKVPEDVRNQNKEKLEQLQGDLEKVLQALDTISLIDS